jgi:hypothetical protein
MCKTMKNNKKNPRETYEEVLFSDQKRKFTISYYCIMYSTLKTMSQICKNHGII